MVRLGLCECDLVTICGHPKIKPQQSSFRQDPDTVLFHHVSQQDTEAVAHVVAWDDGVDEAVF